MRKDAAATRTRPASTRKPRPRTQVGRFTGANNIVVCFRRDRAARSGGPGVTASCSTDVGPRRHGAANLVGGGPQGLPGALTLVGRMKPSNTPAPGPPVGPEPRRGPSRAAVPRNLGVRGLAGPPILGGVDEHRRANARSGRVTRRPEPGGPCPPGTRYPAVRRRIAPTAAPASGRRT